MNETEKQLQLLFFENNPIRWIKILMGIE